MKGRIDNDAAFFMSCIRGGDRSQVALLPAAIKDYVAADAPVRVIDAFVDGLDVGWLGFGRAVPAATGRPPYDPQDLLKLYVCGYLNEVRSSRRLERECSRNVEVMWLLRRLVSHESTFRFAPWKPRPPSLPGLTRQSMTRFSLRCRNTGRAISGLMIPRVEASKRATSV
jgi:hypothetical protein